MCRNKTNLTEDFFAPVIHGGRNVPALCRIDLLGLSCFLVVRRGVFDDAVVTEDPLFRLVCSDELEELLLSSGCLHDTAPIEASCRRNVGWDVSSSIGVNDVVARFKLVVLDSVLVLFFPVGPFADIMTVVGELDGSVSDGGEVWMTSVVVPDCEWLLEAFIVTHNDVIVDALFLVIFLNDL